MSRKPKTELNFSPEADAAFHNIVGLANRLAGGLSGELPTGDPDEERPRADALAMGMLFFLIRIDPDDLHALFFGEGSLAQVPFVPTVCDYVMPPLLAPLLHGRKPGRSQRIAKPAPLHT